MTAFELFNENTQDVILLINFYIRKGNEKNKTTNQKDDFWDYV